MTKTLRATYSPGIEDATAPTTLPGNTVVFSATDLLTDATLVAGEKNAGSGAKSVSGEPIVFPAKDFFPANNFFSPRYRRCNSANNTTGEHWSVLRYRLVN